AVSFQNAISDVGTDSTSTSPRWEEFNVVGVAKKDEAGCGGMLRDGKRVVRSLFFGLINAVGLEMAEAMAIKTALEVFVGMGWHVKVPFIIKSGSCVALE
ncbi:hypothetical protein Golax_002632, partial [Gossypium laxum]|nr:hypothetical protein [Gossypium laxum]